MALPKRQYITLAAALHVNQYADVRTAFLNTNKMSPIFLLSIFIMLASWLVQMRLRNRFELYSKTPLTNGLSGEQIARKMLSDNGITDVRVMSVEGQLTDHYNPADKTVNLSPDVFHGRNAAAAAVAAHECGHAVQHAKAYAFLSMRSALVPVISITSRFAPWVLLAGVLTIQTFPILLGLGIVLFAGMTLFSFITLPVEFDASRRALAWMGDRGIVTQGELAQSKDALWWAAMTYVVAALGSLATLFYYISIFNNRRD